MLSNLIRSRGYSSYIKNIVKLWAEIYTNKLSSCEITRNIGFIILSVLIFTRGDMSEFFIYIYEAKKLFGRMTSGIWKESLYFIMKAVFSHVGRRTSDVGRRAYFSRNRFFQKMLNLSNCDYKLLILKLYLSK